MPAPPGNLQFGQFAQALLEKAEHIIVVPMFFQLAEQRLIAKIFLQVNGLLFIDGEDFRHRAAAAPEMRAEFRKGIVLFYVVVVGRNPGTRGSRNTKIIAVAARLWQFSLSAPRLPYCTRRIIRVRPLLFFA